MTSRARIPNNFCKAKLERASIAIISIIITGITGGDFARARF